MVQISLSIDILFYSIQKIINLMFEEQNKDDYLIDILNQYLKIIKNKLDLTLQLLLYFNPTEERDYQFSHQNINSRYNDLKSSENQLSNSFKNMKINSLSEKRTFDRFCLRVYQQCQKFVIKLKKTKCRSAQHSLFLKQIQILFTEYKNIDGEIQLSTFIDHLINQQENFKLNSLKKTYQEIKISEMDLADELKQIYNKHISLKSSPKNQHKPLKARGQSREIQSKVKQTIIFNKFKLMDKQDIIQNKFQIKTPMSIETKKYQYSFDSVDLMSPAVLKNIHLYNNNRNKTSQLKIVCKHCLSLKIMDIVNIQQIFHNKKSSYDDIFQQLLILNQVNLKMINVWKKNATKRKQKQLKIKKTQKTFDNIQKKQLQMNKNNQSQMNNTKKQKFYDIGFPFHYQDQKNGQKKRNKGTKSVVFKVAPTIQTKQDQKIEQNMKRMTQRIVNGQLNTLDTTTLSNRKNYLEDMLRRQTFQKVWANVNHQIKNSPNKTQSNSNFQQLKGLVQTLVLPKIQNKRRF